MEVKKELKRFYKFLQKDSWQSWVVSIILIIILVRGILFPGLAFITGSSLPLVVVESCSMYHKNSLDSWWQNHGKWYSDNDISKEEFENFPLKNGLNKGDIVFVWGRSEYKKGDIIIFNANSKYPIIHRIYSLNPLSTKGDNNLDSLKENNNPSNIDETNIDSNVVMGKAVGKIPFLGWIKLIFYEPFRSPKDRGLCQES
jgi:signal peptidase I